GAERLARLSMGFAMPALTGSPRERALFERHHEQCSLRHVPGRFHSQLRSLRGIDVSAQPGSAARRSAVLLYWQPELDPARYRAATLAGVRHARVVVAAREWKLSTACTRITRLSGRHRIARWRDCGAGHTLKQRLEPG